MVDSFKKLVPGINPLAATLTEWFSVPAGHEFQGYVRISNLGATEIIVRTAGVSGTGVAPTNKDYEAYNTTLSEGDIIDMTMDLSALETLVVYSDSANAVFNFRGLDIDA